MYIYSDVMLQVYTVKNDSNMLLEQHVKVIIYSKCHKWLPFLQRQSVNVTEISHEDNTTVILWHDYHYNMCIPFTMAYNCYDLL